MVMAMHLDRLAGLVEDAAGEDRHEVGIADGDGERGVLDQVEILVGQRRDDDAHRLRDDDEAQRLPGRKPERARRLGLALRDREDAAPHDLGDEGRGIERQAEDQRREFRRDLSTAGEEQYEPNQVRT